MAFFDTLLGGVNQGLLWALLALGVYITFRLLDFADLTVEGSFACGGAVAAVLITKGIDPLVATLIATLAGGAAGLVTGLLHTKLHIPPILAGILTMIALYSINIRIMSDNSNISMLKMPTVISIIANGLEIKSIYATVIVAVLACGVVIGGLYWFFGTELGASIRATGANAHMCRAQGINTDSTTIMALVISNALVGLSGALVAQQQSYSDVSMGVGAIVIGLASVIIGETIFMRARSFWGKLTGIVVGSIIYRIVITLVLYVDFFKPSDTKLLTAIIVVIALSLPAIKQVKYKFKKKSQEKKDTKFLLMTDKEQQEVLAIRKAKEDKKQEIKSAKEKLKADKAQAIVDAKVAKDEEKFNALSPAEQENLLAERKKMAEQEIIANATKKENEIKLREKYKAQEEIILAKERTKAEKNFLARLNRQNAKSKKMIDKYMSKLPQEEKVEYLAKLERLNLATTSNGATATKKEGQNA
ncbi:MAG: hypothetical protein RR993_00410 [Clostridia bacterium]